MSSIGMNLGGVKYWVGSAPFIDRFKTAGSWQSNATAPNSIVPVDANGFPTGLPAGATQIETRFGVDPVDAQKGLDTYVLLYSGTAKFSLTGAKIISSEPGKIVFEFTSTGEPSVGIKLKEISGTDPISEIHVVRQDQMDLFKAGETFNPTFLAKASQWSVLRFMDWGDTNDLSTVTWDTRPKATDASWSGNAAGVPIEVMVKLANEAKTDMWFNVPTTADDTYVRNAMTYIRNNLDPSLKVHVEYSNEVWNWSMAQSKYARDKANALWGTDVNGDGTIDPDNVAEAAAKGWLQYYGYRAAQVASVANSVFGSDSRLQMVISTQTSSTTADQAIFEGVEKAKVGSVAKLFDEYAVTTYFGNALSNSDADSKSIVLGWAAAGEAGMAAAFQQLEHGGLLPKDTSLDALAETLINQFAVAQNQGLKLIAYEGGAHITPADFTGEEQRVLIEFFGRLMNDPRMGAMYARMVDVFNQAGGSTLIAFNDVGNNGKSGYWGMLDDIYQNSSTRYDALVTASKDQTTTLAAKAKTGDVMTKMAKFTLSEVASNLTYGGTSRFTGTGNDSDNVITGGAGGNSLFGGKGRDTLVGGAGADTLDGGAGADTMSGAAGDDTYIVDDAGDQVIEKAGAGYDEVQTSLASYKLSENVEKLRYTGTRSFKGTGNSLDNYIMGGDAADVLDGGAGVDRLAGGKGNDTYYVDNIADRIDEATDGGYDTVYTTSLEYTLRSNVEALYFTGKGNFRGIGTGENNVIYGNAGNDELVGNSGDDTLVGGDGDDTLVGGVGKDTLSGGAGDDLLNGGGGDDLILGGSGRDRLTGGTGADTFRFKTGDLAAKAANSATIIDFSSAQGDKIHLADIDANKLTKAIDPFRFIGTLGFSKRAGELRSEWNSGGYWEVQGDLNGDGIADIALSVAGKRSSPLLASDFVLTGSS